MKAFVPIAIGALVCAHSPAVDPKPGDRLRIAKPRIEGG